MRSRGTPRLANRLLKRVRDFAQVKYDGRITYDVACFALNLLEVDQYGLDKLDRQILTTLIVNFKGGPVGLDTLAAAIGEDSGHPGRCLRALPAEKRLFKPHPPRPNGLRPRLRTPGISCS